MPIQFVTYQQLDKVKWDACIHKAENGLIYATSVYLDHMSAQWDALVMNDYEAVMPLTWNRKYGIRYLYQPAFTPCLGVFGKSIDTDLVNNFLAAIPPSFRFWEISLNHGNTTNWQSIAIRQCVNYILDLQQPYTNICEGFRDNIKRNIRKSEQLQNRVETGIAASAVIAIAKEQMSRVTDLKEKDWNNFTALCTHFLSLGQAKTYGIYSSSGQLIASCIFFFYKHRACYILVGNHPNGKTLGASHALINAFIKDHAGQPLLLDFEGSDIRNLAFFYSSFGASTEHYPAIRYNRLPFYLKWMKK